jgi:transposase
MKNVGAVVADKAFDATSLIDCIEAMNATAVIPPKANRKVLRSYDKHVYKNRNIIERFFACLKKFCRIAMRYDKVDVIFEAFISIATTLIWLA